MPELAERIASRPGLEQSSLAPLFPFLPATARENVIEAFQREGSRRRPLTRETQITAPHLALAFLETAALSRASDDLASGLARVIGIPETEALRIVREPSGETLAVTLIAIGMPADQAARVLMFAVAGLGESVEGLRRLMRIVETLPRVAATRVVRAFAPSRHTTTQPRHAGLFSPSAPARPQGLSQRREGHAVASDTRRGGTSEEV